MSEPEDVRLVPCETCQSEGRILRDRARHWGIDPEVIDYGPCPVCDGTGGVEVELEPITEEEIMEPS